MVDLWGASTADIRERWRDMAHIVKDAADETDHLAECLQVLFFCASISGYCGRGTGGETILRNYLPEKTAELLLRPDPVMGPRPPPPDPVYLQKHLRPEFPMTRARARRKEKPP